MLFNHCECFFISVDICWIYIIDWDDSLLANAGSFWFETHAYSFCIFLCFKAF